MAFGKTLKAIVLSAALALGACSAPVYLTGCNPPVPKETREEKAQRLYDEIAAFVDYKMPTVEVTAKKTSFTLDPGTWLGNEAKAIHWEFPASQTYYDSVRDGTELAEQFNTAALWLEGDIETYKITITDKMYRDAFVMIKANGDWAATDEKTLDDLIALNTSRGEFQPSLGNPTFYLRPGNENLENFFEGNVMLVIESYKTNYTLDLNKHLENATNHMRWRIGVPEFFADSVEVGQDLDTQFVDWSWVFSKSPSQVTLELIAKED